MIAFHQWIYAATDGRIGHGLLGVPTLLLTTTGRRSGRPHTRALVYAEADRELGVIASWGGSDRHPAWYLNLVDEPEVTVQRRRTAAPYVAHVATGDERARWWQRCDAVNRGRYTAYQQQTEREIPVVVLSPR
ncbi:MAG: nitroreductase family deazaflavin-dependent oxidoreductase [Actinomycetota bacterium]